MFDVVYTLTFVAIGHGLLKKFWTLVLGCVLRTIIKNCADPLSSLELLNYHFTLGPLNVGKITKRLDTGDPDPDEQQGLREPQPAGDCGRSGVGRVGHRLAFPLQQVIFLSLPTRINYDGPKKISKFQLDNVRKKNQVVQNI